MTSLLDQVLSAPAWVVLVVVGLVVFAEDALFVGFVLPGETAALLGGVAAKLGHVSLGAVLATVIVSAVVGDSVGYEVGRHLGPRILAWPILAKRRHRLDRAQDFLARRGGAAVFLGRWTAFFRAVMPALAGTARMPYRTFLAWNAAGGVLWSSVVVTAGCLAGASYAKVEKVVGRDVAFVIVGLVLAGLVVWRIREHLHQRSSSPEPEDVVPVDC
jgi:membrane protein DedA with SNARE-associated domain